MSPYVASDALLKRYYRSGYASIYCALAMVHAIMKQCLIKIFTAEIHLSYQYSIRRASCLTQVAHFSCRLPHVYLMAMALDPLLDDSVEFARRLKGILLIVIFFLFLFRICLLILRSMHLNLEGRVIALSQVSPPNHTHNYLYAYIYMYICIYARMHEYMNTYILTPSIHQFIYQLCKRAWKLGNTTSSPRCSAWCTKLQRSQ